MATKGRGNGEGSIYRRESDGRWCGSLKDERGKRKVVYGKTRDEVARKLAQALAKRHQGLPIHFEHQTVGQFLDSWLEQTVKPTVRPRTYASYSQLVKLHIKPALDKKQLTKLTPQDVQAFLNERRAGGRIPKPEKAKYGKEPRDRTAPKDSKEPKREPLSPRTVQYLRAVLRRALGQALKWGLVGRNVATLVDPPRSDEQEVEPFTPEQCRKLLGAARGDRLEALYTVALALGLRQGEALGLRWEYVDERTGARQSDIDLDAGTLRVRYQLQKIDGQFRFTEPKASKSRRVISLPPFAVAALREHRRRQLEDRLRAGDHWTDRQLVFATRWGTPLEASNVTRQFQAMLKDAGLPRRRFHDMRHTCATLLLLQGVRERVVMEILGHSQMSMMVRYTHVLSTMKQDAAERMEALLAVGS